MEKLMRLQRRLATDREVRGVVILGATGSIGKSTAEIIAGAGGAFRVEAVAGGGDTPALARHARGTRAEIAAPAHPSGHAPLKEALAGASHEPAAGDGAG